MTLPRVPALLAAPLAAALAATALTAVAPSPAAAEGVRPAYRYAGAELLLCRTTSPGGKRIGIRARLDNQDNPAGETRGATVAVTRGGQQRGAVRFPLMRGGRVSAVKSFTFAAGPRTSVSLGINAAQYGNGTTVGLARIRPC